MAQGSGRLKLRKLETPRTLTYIEISYSFTEIIVYMSEVERRKIKNNEVRSLVDLGWNSPYVRTHLCICM